MSPVSYLYIVASRHPRLGKTLIARLLLDFLRLAGRPLVGYDLDPREPSFAACYPNLVWPVDIADTRGQMALFDRLLADNWRTSVIDLGHGVFDQFFKVMTEIGFEQEARRHLIQPIVLFITDAAPVTAQSYAELRRRLTQTTLVPIHNEAASFMIVPGDFRPSSPNCSALRIARLSPLVRGVIDKPGFSFSAYMRTQPGDRPKSIAGSARFSRNFANSNCSCSSASWNPRCAALPSDRRCRSRRSVRLRRAD
jgi:hypothetical protein